MVKKPISKKTLPKKALAGRDDNNFFIIGLGASAGGLEALKLFFDNCPSDSGMAYVVVQHLDPTHKSLLTELIGGHTRMKVFEATDDLKVIPNTVYIIPPDKDLKIFNGTLQLLKPVKARAARRPIDLFFHSLAEDQKDKAIGIILSGTGSEGTLGLIEIKAEGGFTIVQDPHSAQFAGMPQSAITAQEPDYVLVPQKMPAQLLQYTKKRSPYILGLKSSVPPPVENELKKIFMIIRNQTGFDFSSYKISTILRRISKRIALNQFDSIDNYINFLQKEPAEVDKLYRDFLIGVTSFFRDDEVFESIEKKAIPWLFQKCKEKQEIRIWVCGCSTGQEAYSLAILFREALEKYKQFLKVMIFASDIDREAIEFARSGTYSESILQNISGDRLSRYFIRKENGFQLKKEIREMVVFAYHNVIKDPPFSKMDLITCRNLLIYMNSDLQKKIIPVFHYSLTNNGILILGTSESIGEHSELFTDFDSKNKLFTKKRNTATRKPALEYDLPRSKSQPRFFTTISPVNQTKKVNITGLIEKYLLDNYTPPSVIIDKDNEVIYFSGNTGQYLEPPAGEAKWSVLKMAKKGLKPALEAAINKVRNGTKETQTKDVEVKVNGYFKSINLLVKQVPTKETDLGALMVIFEPAKQPVNTVAEKNVDISTKRKANTVDLEKELKITQEHLQSVINDLEISKDTLQTTNEEYQSSNEELQSTNEELETSREELQSVNEELITVNNELQDKIEQLSQSNDDLNNLLTSIEVATLFLDRELKIKRFTPTATKIFNLIPSDIGRPVTHLNSNLVYKTLAEDVKAALKTLATTTTDVYSTEGTWYQMRIIPYRTIENIIEGVLVTFVEITDEKLVEEKLKKTNEQLNLIMENLPAVPFTCIAEPEIKFSFIGTSCEKVTGFLPGQFISNPNFWINRIHPDDKTSVLSAFAGISKKGKLEHPFRWKCVDGKYKQFINFIRFAIAEDGRKAYIVGVWQEVTNNKQMKLIA